MSCTREINYYYSYLIPNHMLVLDVESSRGDSSDVWNMAPGSIETNCRDFPDCTRGDKCPFTHAGREREQNEEAIKIEKNNDFVQPQGLSGLKKK